MYVPKYMTAVKAGKKSEQLHTKMLDFSEYKIAVSKK